MSMWATAEKHPVYFDYGNYEMGRRRYAEAPFYIVKLNNLFYIEPKGTEMDYVDLVGGDEDLMRQTRNGYGYLAEPLLVQEHLLGSGEDTWLGVQRFNIL